MECFTQLDHAAGGKSYGRPKIAPSPCVKQRTDLSGSKVEGEKDDEKKQGQPGTGLPAGQSSPQYRPCESFHRRYGEGTDASALVILSYQTTETGTQNQNLKRSPHGPENGRLERHR